jgi:sirohydrochlorin ferrochelatase
MSSNVSSANDALTAVLLIAHGSRRQEANDDLVRLAELVRSRSGYRCVEISYLELSEPTIPNGGRRCVEQGARQVLMLPYFLSAGRHVTDDLKTFRDEMAAAHPGVNFTLCAPLGLHPRIVDVVLDRLSEA